jgi:hypothetical protein
MCATRPYCWRRRQSQVFDRKRQSDTYRPCRNVSHPPVTSMSAATRPRHPYARLLHAASHRDGIIPQSCQIQPALRLFTGEVLYPSTDPSHSHIHILGSVQNIKIARDAVVSLILGSPPGKYAPSKPCPVMSPPRPLCDQSSRTLQLPLALRLPMFSDCLVLTIP